MQRILSKPHASSDLKYIDLALPAAKTPKAFDFANIPESLGGADEQAFTDAIDHAWMSRKDLNQSQGPQGRVRGSKSFLEQGGPAAPLAAPHSFKPAVGTIDAVYCKGDTGLFGTVFEVWANHWILRTSPEDWWLPLITKVAKRVDDAAERPEVRKMFVGEQKGKKELIVTLPSFNIYDSDYNYLFQKFSEQIDENIHVPGYVDAVSSDFSTTTPAHCISSQITLMKSFQKYFDYTMMACGCGIRGVEMVGVEGDWAQLGVKLQALRTLLAPIEGQLRLSELFGIAEDVFRNLHRTYASGPVCDAGLADWWADILIQDSVVKYGPSGMRRGTVPAYNGWLVRFLDGRAASKFDSSKLAAGEYAETLSCLSSCPMKVVDVPRNITDNSFVVGGMAGFRVHRSSDQAGPQAGGAVPVLQSVHGWCMMLPEASRLRDPGPHCPAAAVEATKARPRAGRVAPMSVVPSASTVGVSGSVRGRSTGIGMTSGDSDSDDVL